MLKGTAGAQGIEVEVWLAHRVRAKQVTGFAASDGDKKPILASFPSFLNLIKDS
jgi:hypothetical protein